jgi:hypothetical protein
MELLLKYGSPVGHINPVLFLLEAGADVNVVDLRGFTALIRNKLQIIMADRFHRRIIKLFTMFGGG